MTEQIQGRTPIGFIVGGTLKDGLTVRLQVPAQDVQEGAFVVIQSNDWIFHGLVTDLQLGSTDPRFADEQSGTRLPAELASLLQGQTLYTNLQILPALMITGGEDPQGPLPVKTVPSHHAPVMLAAEGDIAEIFGKPDAKGNFVIGHTREQGHPVAIDLKKFIQRSSGIFGATGTGKSFLARLLLAGLIQDNTASVLVLDMHNEYAFDDQDENGNPATGLKPKFPAKLRVVGLGAGATIRGIVPDFNLEIAMSDIMPEDIELLTRELNLKETTPTTLDALATSFGRGASFQEFKNMRSEGTIEGDDGKRVPAPGTVAAWAPETGANPMAAEGLHNKLRRG